MKRPMLGLCLSCAISALGLGGERVVPIQTVFQPGARSARILVPDRGALARRVVYLLPVEAAGDHQFGDGMDEAVKLDLANRFGVVLAEPDFAQLPWYADHPANKDIRQESYFLQSVCPQVEASLGWTGGVDRFLVGFSKSGWGAMVLMLRHPDYFRGAAAWDAPLMKRNANSWGMEDIFGTEDSFRGYEFYGLASSRPDSMRNHAVVLLGFRFFQYDMMEAHNLLTRLGVAHVFADGPRREHVWGSGWVGEAVDRVLAKQGALP